MTDKKLSAPHDATTKAAAPDTNRRNLLRTGLAAGGMAAFAAGYGEPLA